jgi:hypothetical protein
VSLSCKVAYLGSGTDASLPTCGFGTGTLPVKGPQMSARSSSSRQLRQQPRIQRSGMMEVWVRPTSRFRDTQQTSRGKFDRLQRATAGFSTSAFDGYGIRGHLPARRALYASIRCLSIGSLLHAAFRPRLTSTPWGFVSLLLHQDVKGTSTPKLSNMLGTQEKGPGNPEPRLYSAASKAAHVQCGVKMYA